MKHMRKMLVLSVMILLLMTAFCALASADSDDSIPLKVIDLGESDPEHSLMPQHTEDDMAHQAPALEPEAEKALTVMVYLCGSDLEETHASASIDLVEMAMSGFDEDIMNLIVMTGGSRKWHIESVPDRANAVYRVGNNQLKTVMFDGRAYNMGDPATLAAFLKMGYEFFPAKQYALILWDHGAGSLGGLCHDTNFNNSALSFYTLQEAFENSPFAEKKLAWIGFDACLMSAAEMAMTIAPYADYMVASEEYEPDIGWDYSFLGDIQADETPVETGTRIIDRYETGCQELVRLTGKSIGSITMACIDLSQVDMVSTAIDGFFAQVDISQENFPQLSVTRRRLTPFGHSEEQPESDSDLVDLGHAIKGLSSFGGEQEATKVLEALQKCVCYSVPSDPAFSGLTLYFPYYNMYRFNGRMMMYQDLLFSDEYTSFIEDFGIHLLRKAEESWDIGDANMGEAKKDNRTNISLSLSEAQAAEVDRVEIIAIQTAMDGEGWHLVATQPAQINEYGSITGEYVHTNLFMTDDEGMPVWDLPVVYDARDDGTYSVPVILVDAQGEKTHARLLCSTNTQNGYVLDVTEVYLYDPVIESYSPRLTGDLKDYTEIIYEIQDRTVTYNAGGALLPFEKWDEAGAAREYPVKLNDGWKLMFVRDYIDTDTVAVAFKITDIYNHVHLSEPIPINGRVESSDRDIYLLDYDDQNLVYIDQKSFFQDPEGLLVLSVMNLTDTGAATSLEHFLVNGKAADLVIPMEGSDPNGRVMPQESATAFVMLPLEEGRSVDEVTFDVVMRDDTGAEFGTIAVRIHRG